MSALFVWWGILCALPPHGGGGWGHRGWWCAVVVVGGMVSEGAAVLLTPRRMLVSPVCVLVSPLVVYPVALLNGGVCGWALSPCSDWVLSFALFSPLLSRPSCFASLLLLFSFPSFVFAVTALLV